MSEQETWVAPPSPRKRTSASAARARFVVVSNRIPYTEEADPRRASVGGLVAAVEPMLEARSGTWLGWNGRLGDASKLVPDGDQGRAYLELSRDLHALYYNGFCNRGLWPLLHGFASRVRYEDREWAAYVEANERFADAVIELATPNATVWVHDFHVFLVASALRRRGFTGKLGFFLHVPFPGLDVFETIPWAEEIVRGALDFDLLGFHTSRYARNFEDAASVLGGKERRKPRVGVFPLGIEPEAFAPADDDPEGEREIEVLMASLEGRKLVLGVDRLDYTKGIPQRLEAFGRMLELHPEWRGRVSLVQVAVPSRSDVPEYREQRRLIENTVGRINGEHGEAHWVPVRYLYRSYGRAQLARLLRAADVGYVTPLRDGMNLVALEYVAAQDPEQPGVLLLSRFAGAAERLSAALLTNPYHRDGLARDLDRALRMPRQERLARHAALVGAVHETTSTAWGDSFLAALERCS